MPQETYRVASALLPLSFLLLVALVTCPVHAGIVGKFSSKKPTFSSTGLHMLSPSPFDGFSGKPLAFADFNNDKFDDVLFQHTDGQIQVLIWNHDQWKMEAFDEWLLPGLVSPPSSDIVGAAVADYNGDGRVDVLAAHIGTNATLFLAKSGEEKSVQGFSASITLPVGFNGWPTAVPPMFNNGDRLGENQGPVPVPFLDNSGSSWQLEPPGCDAVDCRLRPSYLSIPMPDVDPMASAPIVFADLDGDCIADPILLGHQRNDASGSLRLFAAPSSLSSWTSTIVPSGTQSVISLDADSDGALDLALVVCNDGQSSSSNSGTVPSSVGASESSYCDQASLLIIFSLLNGVCGTADAGKNCREVCQTNKGGYSLPKMDYTVNQQTSQKTHAVSTSFKPAFVQPQFGPLLARAGDYDLSGKPGIMVQASNSGRDNSIILFKAQSCTAGRAECSDDALEANRITLIQEAEVVAIVVDSFLDLSLISWVELDTRGVLDVLVVDPEGTVNVFYNNLEQDHAFLKAKGVSGACIKGCGKDVKGLGASCPGTSLQAIITTPEGKNTASMSSQGQCTSHMCLLPSSSLFGLGRAAQLVHTLAVGVNVDKSGEDQVPHYQEWKGIIPNSQIVVSPYKQDKWQIVLFLIPSAAVQWVLLTMLCTLLALAVSIAWLHRKEKKEDKAERKNNEHLLSFDAM